MLIINWLIGFICLIAVVGVIIFPILAIIFGIKEYKKPIVDGGKRHPKTLLFIILTIASFIALILGVIGWGVLSYTLSITPSVI